MKISDNNIENIFNININIKGVFSNHIEQDLVNVVVGLLNKQGVLANGSTLKEQLMALAQQSDKKDLNIDLPASSFGLGQNMNFEGLVKKVQEAASKKSSEETEESPASSSVEQQAQQLFSNFMAINPPEQQ